MSLRLYLIGIAITATSALAVWLWIVWTVDPLVATQTEFILFYASLLIWIVGATTLAGFYVRLFRSHNEYYYGNLLTSLRQGGLIGTLLSTILILRGMRLANLPELILLIIATILFELYFPARK